MRLILFSNFIEVNKIKNEEKAYSRDKKLDVGIKCVPKYLSLNVLGEYGRYFIINW